MENNNIRILDMDGWHIELISSVEDQTLQVHISRHEEDEFFVDEMHGSTETELAHSLKWDIITGDDDGYPDYAS